MASLTSQPSKATALPDPGPDEPGPGAPHTALPELGLWGETVGPMGVNSKGVLRWTHFPWHLLLSRLGCSPPPFCGPPHHGPAPNPLLVLIQAQPFIFCQLYSPHPMLGWGQAQELCPFPASMPRPCLVSVLPYRPLCFGKVRNIWPQVKQQPEPGDSL